MRAFDQVSVDAASAIGKLGAGLSLGKTYYQLASHNFTIAAGTCHSVGLAGLTLGGGKGYLTRLYGLTSDRLVAVDVVDANGNILRADESHQPDLLWMARGGGGNNFPGLVLAFHFALAALPRVVTRFTISWADEHAERVLAYWQATLATWPDPHLWCRFELWSSNSRDTTGRTSGVILSGAFVGVQAELNAILTRVVEELGAPDEPQGTWSEQTTFLELVAKGSGLSNVDDLNEGVDGNAKGWGSDFSTSFISRSLVFEAGALDRSGCAEVARWARTYPGEPWKFYIAIDPANGRVNQLDAQATPYPHRGAEFVSLQMQTQWSTPGDNQTLLKHSQSAIRAIATHARSRRAYVNYLDLDEGSAIAYWGANLARVASVRKQYDPAGRFAGGGGVPLH